VVECDASGSGIGALLHQGGGPMEFYSRQIAPRHSKLAAYERELIRLLQAVRHWRSYLWGRLFMVKANHYNLKYLLDQHLATILQHEWVSKLMGFDFSVEYMPGTTNTVADALSRCEDGEAEELAALSAPTFKLFDDLHIETKEVPALRQLMEVLAGEQGGQVAGDRLSHYHGRQSICVDCLDGNKSLYLIFVGVVFLSILDCF
jgi:hypothetical protein